MADITALVFEISNCIEPDCIAVVRCAKECGKTLNISPSKQQKHAINLLKKYISTYVENEILKNEIKLACVDLLSQAELMEDNEAYEYVQNENGFQMWQNNINNHIEGNNMIPSQSIIDNLRNILTRARRHQSLLNERIIDYAINNQH